MKRRSLLKSTLVGSTLLGLSRVHAAGWLQDDDPLARAFAKPLFIATWPFGKAACEEAWDVLKASGSMLDAIENGINVTELDTTVDSVGDGGLPNAAGVVQLDACIMDGENQKAGAVACVEGYPTPISIARRVMDTTRHVTLVGPDAAEFAARHGFTSKNLLSPTARQAWERWKARQAAGESEDHSHDTIALLGLGADGHLAGGCSTSGLAYKLPGRVGDSPIIGSGLYVDGRVGAAGATGVGENVLRYCCTFLIVEFMRQGMKPTEACVAAIRRVADGDQKAPGELSINFVAINKHGEVGAAGTDDHFRAAVFDGQQSIVLKPVQVVE
jgi:N4-(beta-N-acetylglucosaminyl)-L-asparaginase